MARDHGFYDAAGPGHEFAKIDSHRNSRHGGSMGRMLLVALFIAGCAATHPLSSPDAGPPPTTVPDAGTDAACSGPPFCEALGYNTLVTCIDGVEVRMSCTVDEVCQDGVCQWPPCEPGAFVLCPRFGDGSTAYYCNERGDDYEEVPCPRGCVYRTGCVEPAACEVSTVGPITGQGEWTFDTCSGRSEAAPLRPDCSTAPTGPDLVVRYENPSTKPLRFELTPERWDVHAVLYVSPDCSRVRSRDLVCDDPGLPGTTATVERTLRGGEYFIFMDSAEGACGPVRLRVRRY